MTKIYLALLSAVCLTLAVHASAQTTAFTYQGHLTDAGSPASGTYDLQFSVHDAATNGVTLAGPLTNSAVIVTQGLFTVALDFGPGVFTGPPRWLEIGVRTNGSVTGFTTLAPRQPLTPTPYALFAPVAGTVPDGSISSDKLSPGAAAANLQAGGQTGVAAGGVVLSEQADAQDLSKAGYVKIGRVDLVDEGWRMGTNGPAVAGSEALARSGHSAVWTGTEMIIWGGNNGVLLNTGGRYNPTANSWTHTATLDAPAARANHSAVWTGTEMIIFGGEVYAFLFGSMTTNTGARYNPVSDSWSAIASGGGSRRNHAAFWTGTKMLVYGGTYSSSSIFGLSESPRGDGAHYNPASNTWSYISASGAPSTRQGYSTVWSGTEMIVWGGYGDTGGFFSTRTNYNDGARYRPSNDTWTAVSTVGAPFRRSDHSAVWSGTQMIIWGGMTAEGLGGTPTNYNNGARYNPGADTWSALSTTAAPSARNGQNAVWAGNQMIVYGGTDDTNLLGSGGRYFPSLNTWSNVTAVAQPSPRSDFTTVWTGTEMILWGGYNDFYFDLGGRYRPSTDTWTPTAPTGDRSARRGHTAVWTGTEMIVWGGFDGERALGGGGRLNPALNAWSLVTMTGAPAPRSGHSAVWTGSEMIIWGGGAFLNSGSRYNPVADSWLSTATAGAPTARNQHTVVWTGNEMIIWGGFNGGFLNTGARYNPMVNTWTVTPALNAPAARAGHVAAWSGTEMLVWGGRGGSVMTPVPLATGGRYAPAGNSWSAMATANAPAARTAHQGVWTGDQLLVWGGSDLVTNLNTGGRYLAASNQWLSITTNNAPSARTEHTAVWAGTRMIIWGGFNGANYLPTGGNYDPRTDTWTPTQTGTNSAPGRSQHAAVWDGTEMVVHGGWNGTRLFDDAWQYTPPRTLFLYLKP